MLLNMLKAVRSILNEPTPDAVKCAVKILDEIIVCQEPMKGKIKVGYGRTPEEIEYNLKS